MEWTFQSPPGVVRQLKGRTFEIPGAGGFLVSEYVDELEEYYRVGEEVVCFHDPEDLVDRCRYFLAHETERRAIADAGFGRTLREHTYERRFTELFRAAGLGSRAQAHE
jgi:spore maturation protein CgeB